MFFLVVVGILLSWLVMKLFRFIDPVHHDERKALRKLLEESFGHNEEKAYFEYYRITWLSYIQEPGLPWPWKAVNLVWKVFLLPAPNSLPPFP
jgi:hypothetical protein